MAIQHPTTMQDPINLTAQNIFDEYLPQVLSVSEVLAKRINAVLGFKISGEHGGEWTVNLTEQKVQTGVNKNVDFYLEMQAADFSDMLKGRFDAERAVAENRIDIRGRLDLLGAFGALLRPAGS